MCVGLWVVIPAYITAGHRLNDALAPQSYALRPTPGRRHGRSYYYGHTYLKVLLGSLCPVVVTSLHAMTYGK